MINYMGLKSKAGPNKYKKARYAIGNFSMKDPSKIIRQFEKLPLKSYYRRSHKHEPTEMFPSPSTTGHKVCDDI